MSSESHQSGIKAVNALPNAPLGNLPAHGGPTSSNFPDIVDNENCFQPVVSDSSDDVSHIPSTTLSVANEQQTDNANTGIATQSGGVMVTMPHATSSMSGAPRPAEPSGNSGDVGGNRERSNVDAQRPNARGNHAQTQQHGNHPPTQQHGNHPTTQQHGNHRRIRTQDINIGISTRADAPRSTGDALPDLLHSHMVSPIPASRPNQHRQHRGDRHRGRSDAHGRPQTQHRSRDSNTRSGQHGRRTRHRSSREAANREMCKEPCLKCLSTVTSFRWVLIILSLFGVCCVITGIVLAALNANGNSFLFLAILFIGLGVLLVVVVAVGWKCTPRGHEPLHALCNLGNYRRHRDRRPHRPHRSRDGNWYGGMLYPEFQYRRPPPSYTASMQEYHQQLMLAQQQYLETAHTDDHDNYSLPSSPPPTYRSRAGTARPGVHITFPPTQSDEHPNNSRPPTYRSHMSTNSQAVHVRAALPLDQEVAPTDQREPEATSESILRQASESVQRQTSASPQRQTSDNLQRQTSESLQRQTCENLQRQTSSPSGDENHSVINMPSIDIDITDDTASRVSGTPGVNNDSNSDINTGNNPGLNASNNPGLNAGNNPGLNAGNNPGLNAGCNPGMNAGNNLEINTENSESALGDIHDAGTVAQSSTRCSSSESAQKSTENIITNSSKSVAADVNIEKVASTNENSDNVTTDTASQGGDSPLEQISSETAL